MHFLFILWLWNFSYILLKNCKHVKQSLLLLGQAQETRLVQVKDCMIYCLLLVQRIGQIGDFEASKMFLGGFVGWFRDFLHSPHLTKNWQSRRLWSFQNFWVFVNQCGCLQRFGQIGDLEPLVTSLTIIIKTSQR